MSQMAIGPTPQFDAQAARKALVRALVASVVIVAVALAGLLVLVDRPDWWRGYVAATVSTVLAAAVSLVPLNWGLNRGFTGLPSAVMAAAGLRGAVAIGGCSLAVLVGNYPPAPTLLLVIPFYLTILAVETLQLARLGRSSATNGH